MNIRAHVAAATMTALLAVAIESGAQTTSFWNNASGGDWHTPSNWNPADVPDAPLEEAFFEQPGTYTIRIDRSQFTAGFTNRAVAIATNAADAASVTTTVVAVNTGIGTELHWQVGTNNLRYQYDAKKPAISIGRNCVMALTNVNLFMRGVFGGNYAPAAIYVAPGAFFNMKNGRLDIAGYEGGPRNDGNMSLDGTVLSLVRFSAAGVTDIIGCTGSIGRFHAYGSPTTMRGNSSIIVTERFHVNQTFILTNSTFRVNGAGYIGGRDNLGFLDYPGIAHCESGAEVSLNGLHVRGRRTGGKSAPPCEFWVHAGANVTNTGVTRLGGWLGADFWLIGNGMLGILGGSYQGTNMDIGCLVTGDVHTGVADPDGYYWQTGGSAKFSGLITFYSNTNGLNGCGAMQFVVGSNAVMTLTGAGMAMGGGGPWVLDFNSETNFDTRGTLVFSPEGVETQTLLAFAEESGADVAMTTNHLAVGTLDLRPLVAAGKTLDIAPAGNFGTNAVYVRSLRMGNPANPGAYFTASGNSPESQIYVYYDYQRSDARCGAVFSDGHGALIPVNVPRGTMIIFPGK